MNFKKITTTILIVTLSATMIQAQSKYMMASLRQLIGDISWNKSTKADLGFVKGSAYLTEEFVEGTIYFDGKYQVDDVPLRYNLYNDEMEFKEGTIEMAIAEPKRIDKIVIEDETFIFIEKKKDQNVWGFVKLWNSGYPIVITKMKTNFLPEEPAKPFQDPVPNRFIRENDEHFLMKNNNEIERITSVKKLIKMLGSNEDELTAYKKKEKISSSDAEELAKLVEYFQFIQ